MIKTVNLKKLYTTEEIETTALNNVNISINEGEYVAIMGPSGCGKSTLLNILGLLDNPSSGEFHFLDHEVSHYSERQRADLRKANIGFVFQMYDLVPVLTAQQNVELPLLLFRMSSAERRERVGTALDVVGLTDRADHRPNQLSGGEEQRVAIARALINRPTLLLADEPTGNLDRTTAESVGRLLLEMQQQEQAMLVVVTHSQALAQRLARRCEIDDGRLEERR